MQHFKLLSAIFRMNVQMSLAYRVDTLVNILINIMWLGWELLSLNIIFSNTATLGGWGFGEMVALLGVFRLVNALMAAVIWPNTERFNTSIRDGSFDYVLLQPASSLVLVSLSRIVIWRVWDLVLAAVLITTGISLSAGNIQINLVSFLFLAASGMLIIYSLWIVLIALTFWFVKFDNIVTILQALLEAGRYPVTVYPAWLRLIVTFVVPIAVATTVPLQGLRGELTVQNVFLFLAIGAASFFVASLIWKQGIRRYSGASS
ncbi:MAG: hypothetical protein EHM70_19350 [Chloroflexota bacterium]|nr:MAG: hypothetical protein EHM70_19350 [Chloroflexota bacterium]